MKKQLKYCLIFSSIVAVLFLSGCTNENLISINDNKSTINNTSSNEENQKDIEYYKDNEMINKFINIFNRLYNENSITSDMISVYDHHGSDHKNQVQFYLKDKQITLTNENTNTMSVYIDNLKGADDDVIKDLTIMFTKVFDTTLTIEEIESYWNKQKESGSINNYNDIEYQTSQTLSTGKVEYIKITSKIK